MATLLSRPDFCMGGARFLRLVALKCRQSSPAPIQRCFGGVCGSEFLETTKNYQLVFRHKSSADLVRGYLLLSICRIPFFARNAYQVFTASQTLLGPRLFELVFMPLVYDRFIAGEKKEDIMATMINMTRVGLKPLLSPMLEDNLGMDTVDEARQSAIHARNLRAIKECLELCSDPVFNDLEPKALAIKLTAFMEPDHLNTLSQELSKGDLESLLNSMSSYIDDARTAPDTPKSIRRMRRGLLNVVELGRLAREKRIVLFIDAEYSHLQPAVRLITLGLMKRFNKEDQVAVANTYQCYLKDSRQHVLDDLALSRRHDFCLGIKLVRGAYLEMENARAKILRISSPIHHTYEATSNNFNWLARHLVRETRGRRHPPMFLLLATHNVGSVYASISEMKASGVQAHQVHFAQISGMGDQLSLSLCHHGHSCLKLVPCGSVAEVLPWLSRRMQENAAVRERMDEDRRVVRKEILRRIRAAVSL